MGDFNKKYLKFAQKVNISKSAFLHFLWNEKKYLQAYILYWLALSFSHHFYFLSRCSPDVFEHLELRMQIENAPKMQIASKVQNGHGSIDTIYISYNWAPFFPKNRKSEKMTAVLKTIIFGKFHSKSIVFCIEINKEEYDYILHRISYENIFQLR